ncbi:MAG: CalY family protein [Candidatus Dormibacteraeota bacterium]|nr:CalY family protein [Candidatus Dormibacteraeota bacterium]
MNRKRLRQTAGLVAAGATVLALIGVGVGAVFSDSATATANISVGTFEIQITSSLSNTDPTHTVAVNTGNISTGNSVHTLTYTCPVIMASAASATGCVVPFTVTSTGSIPANVTVAASTVSAPFSNLFVNPGQVTLASGDHRDYSGGLAWTELSSANAGQTITVTYTVTAQSAS